MVWWLRLCASNAGATGSIPGPGNEIPQALGAQPEDFFKKKGSKK